MGTKLGTVKQTTKLKRAKDFRMALRSRLNRKKKLVPGVGVEPLGGIDSTKLLILRNSKMERNHKNAEVRYTAGTRNDRRICRTAWNMRTRKRMNLGLVMRLQFG